MRKWSVDNVYIWLIIVFEGELSSLASTFKKNNIDGKILQNLTGQDLKKLINNEYLEKRFKLLRDAQSSLNTLDNI